MKCCISVLIIFLFTLTSFGQTAKIYITKDGNYSTDATKAVSYQLIQKLSDTVFYVRQYNMEDSIMMRGPYRDMQLSIPNGDFIYYLINSPNVRITYDYDSHKFDTIKTPRKTYKSQTGSFYRGIKEGKWVDYGADGSLVYVRNYKAGKLNGLSQDFYAGTNKLSAEGTCTNDLKEGSWQTFSVQGDTIKTEYYVGGVLKKTVSHLKEDKFLTHIKYGHPDFELDTYLFQVLPESTMVFPSKRFSSDISFTLSADGKLTNAIIENVNNFNVDKTIIEALLKRQNWIPTYKDLIPVESKINIDMIFAYKNGEFFRVVSTVNYSIPGYNGY